MKCHLLLALVAGVLMSTTPAYAELPRCESNDAKAEAMKALEDGWALAGLPPPDYEVNGINTMTVATGPNGTGLARMMMAQLRRKGVDLRADDIRVCVGQITSEAQFFPMLIANPDDTDEWGVLILQSTLGAVMTWNLKFLD